MNDLTLARKRIKECKNTQNPYLDLGKCGITDLDELPELFECDHVETLILSNSWYDPERRGRTESANNGRLNCLSFIPETISNLKKLTKLVACGDIEHRWALSDIRFLEKLTQVYYLDLSFNEIFDIRVLSELPELQSLYLSFNEIFDIDVLGELPQLQVLSLSSNRISDIDVLGELPQLQYLALGYNEISDLHVLGKLTQLESLDLRKNILKEIPLSVFQLNMEIRMNEYAWNGLCLGGNPIESPPLEIIKQGRQSVLDWFEAKKKKLNEIKVILIGEPKAGKTSLLRRLKWDTFDKNEVQTDGVNIEEMEFGECPTFEKQKSLHGITGHFWDFGGQEIMNATHQFFLTKRSVYVLVIDARKDARNATQIRHWVKQIRATGGDSPIIVLANQIDVNPGFGFENERELQEEFPQIKCFLTISCETKENIELLKEKLEELIPTAELFKTEIDERWIAIKEILEQETKESYFLDESRFLSICNEANITARREQKNIITFLHDLGLILHFEELKLAEYYVLDPYWITYGVYQILTSVYAGKKKGIVGMDQLEYIVNDEEDKKERYQPANYKKIRYSTYQRHFLVSILHQFKLCFCTADNKQFIIPDLLDTMEPLDRTEPIRSSEEAVCFLYRYDYLPKSILPNIMVEMHHSIEAMWRTGCVLKHDGCKALITTYQEELSITVTGEHKKKREFLSVVRHCIDSINTKLNIRPTRWIPLPGVDVFVKYELLLVKEKKRKPYIFDEDGEKERYFDVSKLLEGVPDDNEGITNSEKYSREILSKMDHVTCDLKEIKEGINSIQNKLDSHYELLINIPCNVTMKEQIQETIEELTIQQTTEILEEFIKVLNTFHNKMDDKSKAIYTDLMETKNVRAKLKLAIPFVNILGIQLETEFDIQNWIQKMYQKYELKVLRYMGKLP